MMFKRSAKSRSAGAQVQVSLVRAGDLEPLTERVWAEVRGITKKGVVLWLASAFIGEMHVLMDVHNTTAKLVRLDLEPQEEPKSEPTWLVGEVGRFNRVEGPDGVRFEVELTWAAESGQKQDLNRAVKSLTRLVKSRPQPEAP